MYVCVYLYIYAFVFSPICPSVYLSFCLYVNLFVCLFTHACVCICVCLCIFLCLCACVCVCVCMCVYGCVSACWDLLAYGSRCEYWLKLLSLFAFYVYHCLYFYFSVYDFVEVVPLVWIYATVCLPWTIWRCGYIYSSFMGYCMWHLLCYWTSVLVHVCLLLFIFVLDSSPAVFIAHFLH